MNGLPSTRSWVCPQHENFTLSACVDAGCLHATLAAAAPELLSTLRDVVARIGKTPVRMDLSEAHALLRRFK